MLYCNFPLLYNLMSKQLKYKNICTAARFTGNHRWMLSYDICSCLCFTNQHWFLAPLVWGNIYKKQKKTRMLPRDKLAVVFRHYLFFGKPYTDPLSTEDRLWWWTLNLVWTINSHVYNLVWTINSHVYDRFAKSVQLWVAPTFWAAVYDTAVFS